MKLFLLMLMTIFLLFCSTTIFAGRCTGSSYCSACKNCSACKHCNGGGGTCGVCGGGSSYRQSRTKTKSYGSDKNPTTDAIVHDDHEKNSTTSTYTSYSSYKEGDSGSHVWMWILIIAGVLYLIVKSNKK